MSQLDGKVDVGGDTMTGHLNLIDPPIAGNNAVTKDYVDNATTSGGLDLGGADRFVRYFSGQPPAAGQQDGDVSVSGSVIYMWASGAWRQVFPAEYS